MYYLFYILEIFLTLIKNTFQQWNNYPEDHSSLDYLSYNENEIHLVSFYLNHLTSKLNDYKNGIIMYPINSSKLFGTKCPSIGNSPSVYSTYIQQGYDNDNEWSISSMSTSYFPPKYRILFNSYYSDNNMNIIVINPQQYNSLTFDSINNRLFSNELYNNDNIVFNYYLWITPRSNIPNLKIGCIRSSSCEIDGSKYFDYGYFQSENVYQVLFQYKNEKFYLNSNSFSCPKNSDGNYELILMHNGLRLNHIKMTYQIISDLSCENDNNCPPGTRCNNNICEKCDGRYSICKNIEISENGEYIYKDSSVLECSRFTQEWTNPNRDSINYKCNADYFNINKLGFISFNIKPIKSGSASVSFWFFTLKPNYSSEGIFHIYLSDYMICTILVENGNYDIYVTGYEIYHFAYGNPINETKSKSEFLNVIQLFPYKNWYIKGTLSKFYRWVNIRFSFNINKGESDSTKITLLIQYYKFSLKKASNNIENSDNIEIQYSKSIPNEYIYGTEETNGYRSEIHFKKFFRTNDNTYLHLINNFEKQLYIKNLYVFATDFAESGSTTLVSLTKGLQYYAFENIFSNNILFPELFFACPFDSISFDYLTHTYSIKYYTYDIYNDGTKSSNYAKIRVTENIDNYLYSYHYKLYRLNLINTKNYYFTNNDLTSSENLDSSTNYFCFNKDKRYSCYYENRYVILNTMLCSNSCTDRYNVGKGLNYNTYHRGICTYSCDLNCENNAAFSTTCPTSYYSLFNICLSNGNTYVTSKNKGSLYYSYFFNLPPIKLTLEQEYTEFYMKFNFRYETNRVIRPGIRHKGFKIYILYTNSFRIWHDFTFNYIGVEDNNKNDGKNLRPYFNIDNKNSFTIKIYKVKNSSDNSQVLLMGNIYLNNNKNHAVDFNVEESLKYIYFCHNDSDCNFFSDSKNVYWTSGFYDNIKLYRPNNTLINDDVIYHSHIYDDVYLYYSILLPTQLLDQQFIDTTEIPLSFYNLENNNFKYNLNTRSSSTLNLFSPFFDSTAENIQGYNYADYQDLPIRETITSITNKYTGSDGKIETCLLGKSCYGSDTENPFSDQCTICDDSLYKYFRFSNCEEYPNNNQYYYVLPFPFITNSGITINNSPYSVSLSNTRNDRYTFFFYLKLLGFPSYSGIQYRTDIRRICVIGNLYIYYFINDKKLRFSYNIFNNIITEAPYNIEYYGKYIPISIAYFLYLSNIVNTDETGYIKSFFSIQVNNIDYASSTYNVNMSSSPIYFYPNEFYGTIANFHYYQQALIGAYAFETNTQYQSRIKNLGGITPTNYIVDERNSKCLLNYNNIHCIVDYDVQLNKNNYPKKGFPNDKQLYTTENDYFKNEDCSNECGSFCYNKNDPNSCACSNEGINDYLIRDSNNRIKCKKLLYYDIQRINQITFTNLPVNNENGGWGMWFYVYYESFFNNQRWGYPKIKIDYCKGYGYIKTYSIQFFGMDMTEYFSQKKWMYFQYNIPNKRISLCDPERGCYSREFSPSIYSMTSTMNINYRYFKLSTGLIFIKQFQIWTDIRNVLRNLEIKETINRKGFGAVIDTNVNSNEVFTVKSYNSLASLSSISYISTAQYEFGYYPITHNIENLELKNEYDDQNIDSFRLNAFNDISVDSIPPSVTNCYTIEMWIRIIHPEKLINGFNVIWEKHIALSVVNDNINDKLTLFCFPQDYLFSPKGKKSQEIFILHEEAFNSEKFGINNIDYNNTWVYVRCAFNWINEIYYEKVVKASHEVIYQSDENIVVKENTYEGKKVDYPYKYFFYVPDKSNLRIENQRLNTNSIINIRNIYLYNEYLLPAFNTLRVKFSENKYITSLVFGMNLQYSSTNTIKIFYQGKGDNKIFSNYDSNYKTEGSLYLCEANSNTMYSTSSINCATLTTAQLNTISSSNAKIYHGTYILECNSNYYLDVVNNKCIYSKCPSNTRNRFPGTKTDNGFCSYNIGEHQNRIDTPLNYINNLKCHDGYTRVGYKCLNTENQENSIFYFNHCYNFLPAYKKFTDVQLANFVNDYVVEFWFKFDKVNEFCGNSKDRYVLWVYPHSLFQYANNDKVYYKDLFLSNVHSSTYSPVELPSISLYEWNYIFIEYRKGKGKVNIWINFKMAQPDYSYDIENQYLVNDTYMIRAFAFCNGNHNCVPLERITINWSSAYYYKMKFYNISSSSIKMVIDTALGRVNPITNNIIIHYRLKTVDNDLNIIYDEHYPKLSNPAFNINDNLPSDSLYRVDDVILLYSSTTNYDWGIENENKYIISQEVITGKTTSGNCYSNCKRCYSSAYNDCYECYDGYVLYYNQCKEKTGFYPRIPNIANYIYPNIVKNNFEIDKYNPLTVSLWIKFYGIDYGNLCDDININCVLIIQISIQNKVHLCFNKNSNNILVYYNNDTILYEDSLFSTEAGKWILISFSNYNSNFNYKDTTSYYPSMFSFSYNGYTVPRSPTYNIPEPGILIDTIILGAGISGLFSDLRFYHSFILNPYGIVTNDESYEKLLIYNLKLYDANLETCISTNDLVDSHGLELSFAITCIYDYNVYHEIDKVNCNKNKYKRVDYLSLNNECLDCINECYYCGGEEKSNCACYYNDIYWFRNEISEDRLYCQKLPYHDFNIYSDLQFTDISYATTNEYSIEFWYFIYEYKKENHIFKKQLIQWTDHNKILITKKDDNNVYVDCYPLQNNDETIIIRDSSQKYFQWNHIICATNLNKNLYYLNNLPVKTIESSFTYYIDYSHYGNAKTRLIFRNEASHTSHGIFLIRELKLWSLFSMREFPTNCAYNLNYMKNHNVNFLLHYYPFNFPDNGLIYDSKGNEPKIKVIKNDIIGYNLVDFENLYSIIYDFEECLIVYSIPSIGYFNQTHFFIKTYLETPLSNEDLTSNPTYTFKFYLSEDAKKEYSEITPGNLNVENYNNNAAPNEVLISKFTDLKFNNSDINIYVTETNPISGIVKIGFTRIKVIDFSELDINLEDYLIGLDDDINVDSSDLSSKVFLSEEQIWNRIKTLSSLGEIPNIALTSINMTETELTFIENNNINIDNFKPIGININNPICSKESCSIRGNCFIIVRATQCFCFDGYKGTNCHLTVNNKNCIENLYEKFWNYLTNNNNLNTLSSSDFNNKLVGKLLYLVKTSLSFSESNSNIINNFYLFFDYLYNNYPDLIGDNYQEFFLVFDYISINLYKDINYNRLYNYVSKSTSTTNNNLEEEDNIISQNLMRRNLKSTPNEIKYPEDLTDYTQNVIYKISLTKEQITTNYDYSLKLIQYIKKVISLETFKFKQSLYLTFQGYDIIILSVTEHFNYTRYFINKIIENKDNKFYYKSYIDVSSCSSHIFKQTTYTSLFLIFIQYRYNPLSFYSTYSTSSSFLNDIFFMDKEGNIISLTDCSNNYKIYFPLNSYNRTKTNIILTHSNFIFNNPNIGPNHPYVTWPVYVFNNGTVCKKSRTERIQEVYKLMNSYCTYYDYYLKIDNRIEECNFENNYFISCNINHLGLFSLEINDSNVKYKTAHLFFYLEAYRIFKDYKNFINIGLFTFGFFFIIFIFGIVIISIIDYTKIQRTKNLLDGIKTAIFRENTFFYTSEELNDELNDANKLYNEDQMINDLEIKSKVKEISSSNIKEKNSEIKTHFSKNKNKKNKKQNKNQANLESEEPFTERETQVENISKFHGNNPPKKKNSSMKIKKNNNESNFDKVYNVENYKIEAPSEYNDIQFGFINDSEESEKKSEESEKISEESKKSESVKIQNVRINDKESEHESYNISNIEKYSDLNTENNNDKLSAQSNKDFLSKFNNKNTNNFIDKNVIFIKNFDTRIKVNDIFQDIEEKNISNEKFLKWCLIKRNIYLSVFSNNSSLNPKWKRLFIIYIYILFQFFFVTFYLSLFERINISKFLKVLFIHSFVLISSNCIMYGVIYFFRVDDLSKAILLVTLRSSQQMKLIADWKKMKKKQRKKIIIGFILFFFIFIITFYFYFTYIVILYMSKFIFLLTLFTGLILDLFIYEGFMNLLLSFFYNDRKNRPFKQLFLLRCYRNCL